MSLYCGRGLALEDQESCSSLRAIWAARLRATTATSTLARSSRSKIPLTPSRRVPRCVAADSLSAAAYHFWTKRRVPSLPSEKEIGFVLFRWARSIERNVRRRSVSLDQMIGDKIVLNFLAADIRQHRPVNFDAG